MTGEGNAKTHESLGLFWVKSIANGPISPVPDTQNPEPTAIPGRMTERWFGAFYRSTMHKRTPMDNIHEVYCFYLHLQR